MRYAVTYLVSGERRADRVEAPDAAAAVAVVHETRGREPHAFELLSVLLLDDRMRARAPGRVERAPTP